MPISKQPDMLEELFKKQAELQDALGYKFNSMSLKERSDYIKEYSQHTDHEMHEMLQELPYFKGWKRYPEDDKEAMHKAYERAREEMIDALHFFLNVCIGLGFTPKQLFAMYMGKHEENYIRQTDTRNYKKCIEEHTNECK